jgi:putative sigma-54 modulation protein
LVLLEEEAGVFLPVDRRSIPVQINISARHGNVSDATRERIVEKVEKLTRYFDRLVGVDVTIDLERREEPAVEVRVSAEHKHDFVATAQSADMMASIDQAIYKLEQQLRKYKEKVQDRHRGTPDRELEVPGDVEPTA